jgi:5-deoxy-D-glucuronate isomerase
MHTHPSFTGDRKSGSTPDTTPSEHIRYKEHPTAQKGHIVFMRVLKDDRVLSKAVFGRDGEIVIVVLLET